MSGFELERPAPKWINLPDFLHRNRCSHGAVVLDREEQKILVVGGWEDANHTTPLRSVEVYDRLSNKWKNKKWPKLNQCRAEHATVLLDNKVYVIGGRTCDELLDSIECLDLSSSSNTTPKWTILDVKLPTKKSACTAVAVNSIIYIMGGYTTSPSSDKNNALDSVAIFDAKAMKLYKGPSLKTARFGCASELVGSTIYLAGGQDKFGATLDTMETLAVGTFQYSWQEYPITLSVARMYPAICLLGQCLVILGGRDTRKRALKSVEVLDTKRRVVWTLPEMSQARAGCTAVALSKSRIVVLAGCDLSNTVLNSTAAIQLESCPLPVQIAAVEHELKQVRGGRGSSLNPFKTAGSKENKAKSASLKALLRELKQSPAEESETSLVSQDRSFSSAFGDELPVYDNGRIVAKKELKASGQARVYKGVMKDRDGSKKDVAIKVFKSTADWDECKQELMTLLKISGHPNVMEVLDFFEVPMPSFIMRFVAGGDLRDYLDKKGRFTGERAVRVLQGIGQGLLHLHSNEIVHRDLKSPNILLEGKGNTMRPVVIDLGLGKKMDAGGNHHDEFQTRGLKGTAHWMAPEMIADAKWSTKTDMYALGIIMWEIVTGAVPYPGKNFMQIITHVHTQNGRPEIRYMTKAKVPQTQIDLVQSLWHKDPTRRPSAQEFLARLG